MASIIRINKARAKKFKRAFQYLQAAIAHTDLKYLRQVSEVQDMVTKDILLFEEMSNSTSAVGYRVGVLEGYNCTDAELWVGFSLTDNPGDSYRYHAWAVRACDLLTPNWPAILAEGVDDQQKFTFILKKALGKS